MKDLDSSSIHPEFHRCPHHIVKNVIRIVKSRMSSTTTADQEKEELRRREIIQIKEMQNEIIALLKKM